jgi:hypothetical protein
MPTQTPANLERAKCLPLRIGGPIGGVDLIINAEPDRAHIVVGKLLQAKLPLQNAGATTGIDNPTGCGGRFLPGAQHGDCVKRLPKRHPLHAAIVPAFYAALDIFGIEHVFKTAAVQLMGRSRQHAGATQFNPLCDVAVAIGREEKA